MPGKPVAEVTVLPMPPDSAGKGDWMTTARKVAFFRGASLRPVPPGESKQKEVRYIDIREDDQFDEALMANWIRQASKLPGWIP